MAFDYSKQFLVKSGHHWHEYGQVSFTTTGLTKTIDTKLGAVRGFAAISLVTTGNLDEKIFCPGTISGGKITVTRAVKPIFLHGVADPTTNASNDYVEAPLFICPAAGVMTGLWWYNHTKAGGSPLMEVGKVPTYGAGSANVDFFVDSADDATNSHVPPNSSVGKSIFALTDSGTYANGSRVITAGDLITLSTTGGTTSDAAGTQLSMSYAPTPTSGLTFWYHVWGI